MPYGEYDDGYPIDPYHIDYDTARSINPGIRSQHMSRDIRPTQDMYKSAPFGVRASYPPPEMSSMSTFTAEKRIYDTSIRVDYIFWMCVCMIIIFIFVAVVSALNLMVVITMSKKNA